MIVCICKNISDSQIRQSVRNGAENLQQVRNELDVASQCCKCLSDTKDIIKQELALQNTDTNHTPMPAFGIFSPV